MTVSKWQCQRHDGQGLSVSQHFFNTTFKVGPSSPAHRGLWCSLGGWKLTPDTHPFRSELFPLGVSPCCIYSALCLPVLTSSSLSCAYKLNRRLTPRKIHREIIKCRQRARSIIKHTSGRQEHIVDTFFVKKILQVFQHIKTYIKGLQIHV